MTDWIYHFAEGSFFRCADCGARSCCDFRSKCTVKQKGPFKHRWVTIGTGRKVFRHKERA